LEVLLSIVGAAFGVKTAVLVRVGFVVGRRGLRWQRQR